MKKLTFEELCSYLHDYNEAHYGKGYKPIDAKVVFKASNWPDTHYSDNELSYIVSSDNKAFRHCLSTSIYAHCVDPNTDQNVRLDYYMKPYVEDGWEVDYCEICDD